MKIISGIWLIVYVLAWWTAFWLPARKCMLAPLIFIPAAFCAFVIPMMVADMILKAPHDFFVFWSVTPFAVVAVELLWRMKKKKNPNQSPDFTRALWGGSNGWKHEQGPSPKIGTCRRGKSQR